MTRLEVTPVPGCSRTRVRVHATISRNRDKQMTREREKERENGRERWFFFRLVWDLKLKQGPLGPRMMDSRHVSHSLNVLPRNSLGAFDTSVRAAINDVIIDNLLCRTLNRRRMADNLEQSCRLDARFRSGDIS